MPLKANPLRPGHLRVARERLGLTQYQVGCLAGFTRYAGQRAGLVERGQGQRDDVRPIMLALITEITRRRWVRWEADRRARAFAEDQRRIADQEKQFAALPDCPAKEALIDAMIERCFDLMCEGKGAECDAISEWLPPDRVSAMFAAWERWDAGDQSADQPAESSGNRTATPS